MAINLKKRAVKGEALTHAEVDQNWTDIETELGQKAPSSHTHTMANISGLSAALTAKMDASRRGVANGVASLDSSGKVPMSQLPSIGGATGMFFPHDTLTSEDVGKLVIWKDGKCQLPVFEPAVPSQPKQYRIEYTKGSFDAPVNLTRVIFKMDSLPSNDSVMEVVVGVEYPSWVNKSYSFQFKNSPTLPNEVKIESTIEQTVDNVVALISTKIESGSITINRIADDEFQMVYAFLGWVYNDYEDIEYKSTLVSYISPVGISVTTEYNDYSRVGDSFVGFHLFNRLKTGDQYFYELLETGPTPYDWFFSNITYTLAVKMFGYDDESVIYVPSSYQQMQEGLAFKIKEVPGVVDAYWEDNMLIILHDFEDDVTFVGSNHPGYYNFNFGTESSEDGVQGLPAYCKYPIVGLVKSVTENQVEIHSEPICRFKSSYIESVVWSNLMDPRRCWVLDPAAPGYLMPIFAQEISSFDTLVTLATPGYVWSMDNEVQEDSLFTGAFSLDLFPLQVLYLAIISSEGGD